MYVRTRACRASVGEKNGASTKDRRSLPDSRTYYPGALPVWLPVVHAQRSITQRSATVTAGFSARRAGDVCMYVHRRHVHMYVRMYILPFYLPYIHRAVAFPNDTTSRLARTHRIVFLFEPYPQQVSSVYTNLRNTRARHVPQGLLGVYENSWAESTYLHTRIQNIV